MFASVTWQPRESLLQTAIGDRSKRIAPEAWRLFRFARRAEIAQFAWNTRPAPDELWQRHICRLLLPFRYGSTRTPSIRR